MISHNLYDNTRSHKISMRRGRFKVMEFDRDFSVSPERAQEAWFASQMNVKKRQLIASIEDGSGIIVQAGLMQLLLGHITVSTNIKGAGDLMKKFVGSRVTGETVIKPRYVGDGTLVLEPTFRYVLLQDLNDWQGAMVIEDGMFMACDDSIDLKVTARHSLSSAVLGGEGLFNTTLMGEGIVALESPVPEDELLTIDLEDDELRIDGNMAVAWSYGLQFTVEKTTATLIGSAASGEGLVNVYRGTGRVLVAPVEKNHGISSPKTPNP